MAGFVVSRCGLHQVSSSSLLPRLSFLERTTRKLILRDSQARGFKQGSRWNPLSSRLILRASSTDFGADSHSTEPKKFQLQEQWNADEIEELRCVWQTRWNWFHRPIHAVAHVLHPLWRSEDQSADDELENGIQKYFEKWAAGDLQMVTRLEDELLLFRNHSLSFGRSTAQLRETQLQPVSWWEKYGASAPTLKRLAIRVLSQDCSSGPCERNWSTWALFHTKKRNRLSTAQLERLVFCHCNLRLLEHTSTSPEPRQVHVDKVDIEKVKDIPDIPREELDIYTILYEEMSAPAHRTRASRRATSWRDGANTSAAAAASSASTSSHSELDSTSTSASASDAETEDQDSG